MHFGSGQSEKNQRWFEAQESENSDKAGSGSVNFNVHSPNSEFSPNALLQKQEAA